MDNQSKKLIINNKTNLSKITNKNKYEKLTIQSKVNPKKLNDFTNIKKLTIDYLDKGEYNYNEKNINSLPFKDKLEKITFKQIKKYGILKRISRVIIFNILNNFPNLKSIEFPESIRSVCTDYLKYVSTLEEIIFNVNEGTFFYSYLYSYSSNLKRLIIKSNQKEYILDLDYEITAIRKIIYNDESDTIYIEYYNDDNETEVTIDLENDKVNINNIWNAEIDNYILYIPDYVTELGCYFYNEIHELSFNLSLLDNITDHKDIMDSDYYSRLRTIELRSNNEMSLFPNKEIDVKEYGNLEDLYIENNLLYLEYEDKTITINSKGEINKIDTELKIEETSNTKEFDLKKYTLEELENYVSF